MSKKYFGLGKADVFLKGNESALRDSGWRLFKQDDAIFDREGRLNLDETISRRTVKEKQKNEDKPSTLQDFLSDLRSS